MTRLCFIDTETTGLLKPKGIDVAHQPRITEISIYITNKKYKVLKSYNTLINPGISLEPHIVRITNITDNMLRDKKKFKKHAKKIKKLIEDSNRVIAQNLPFDKGMIDYEFERLNKKVKWPFDLFCTVEQSMFLKGIRLKSTELFQHSSGGEINNIHRAEADVLAMIKYYDYILKMGKKFTKEIKCG